MENIVIKINLANLEHAIKFKKDGVKYVALPMAENFIFEGMKGIYLTLAGYVSEHSKYGDTHYIKLSIPKAKRELMTEEERRAYKIAGNVSVMQYGNEVQETDGGDFESY